MFSVKTFIMVALLAELVLVVESSVGEGASSHSFDLSRASDLRRLYNLKVYKAEMLTRALEILGIGPIVHFGVRVTLGDGSTWLVHKGDGYGVTSQTVVVDARHMSSHWEVKETKDFGGTKTVADFVKAGGSDYSLLFNNCHHGAGRMMNP